ncbi:glycosyltransferase family 39 protein, partial [Patescibacteria group bacterium]|nr:glycosyltransferase family 39 protein [Patescibacteria group bacterium]
MELKQRKYDFLALVILGVMFFLAVGSMREDSAIRDEMPHIVAGYSYITQADYRLNPEHPPLVKQLSALPLLFMKINFPKEDAGWKYNVNDQWSLGDTFLYKSGNDADKMLFWARIPIVILMLLAGFVVYLWASEIFKNKLAGFLALLLYAFSPNIIAHGRFITTDMGVTAFSVFALYSWWKFLKEPGWSKFLIAALLQGCLHLAKFSIPILLPIIGIMTIFAIFSYSKQWGAKKRWAIYLASVMSATIIAFLLVGVWYKIFMREMPLDVQQRLIAESIWDDQFGNAGLATKLINLSNIEALRPYVQYALGFFMVAAHASYGHSTYFMGDVGQNWPEYYFIAYLLKEPLASQIILYTFL